MSHETEPQKIEQFYTGVPEGQREQLRSFRKCFPYRVVEIQGRLWRYIDSGKGRQVILVFAGATTVAEISFQTLEYLAQNYRVIAPDYPPIRELKEFFDGCDRFMDILGVEHFCLIGGSYGGWMAQSYVRHSPDRVQKLVISVCGPPDPENSQKIARILPWLRLTPTFLLRAMLMRVFSGLMTGNGHETGQALLAAHLKEILYTRVKRVDLLAAMQRLVDQTRSSIFLPDDLKDWTGRILLLFGSDDPATPPEKREAMQQLYPGAEMKVFEGADHTVPLTHQREYFTAMDAFLKD